MVWSLRELELKPFDIKVTGILSLHFEAIEVHSMLGSCRRDLFKGSVDLMGLMVKE